MPSTVLRSSLPEAFAQTGSVSGMIQENMRWEKIECSFSLHL